MALPVINPALTLPVPQVIERLGYETLLSAWRDRFGPLFLERKGKDYDFGVLETDPGVIIAEAFSYLRLTDRQRINEVYVALRLALATGADLDGLAADRGVRRLVYVPSDPDTGAAAVMEGDESLRLRTWLKMQTWGLGSPYGVEYAARTIGLGDLADARCYDFPGEGRMLLVLLPNAGRTDTFEPVRARVAAHVMDRRRRPGAVFIDTVPADIVSVPVSGVLGVRRGASQAAVIASAGGVVEKYMATRRRIGALVPHSALDAAAHVADVVWAHLKPELDRPIPPTAAAELGALSLTAQLVDD